ncbi:hypothetical protein RHODO2019_05340 [Rhodococcus antarcticus]|jgi:hypothetical protein|uniref:Uncharacterized protein n=1 Tax=Rhodococcus antarcticus TaxID=2987751 RepID=A0ABY6P2I6_9NOCA|nr:hypothetical protein [Rhodococcus antarcticus]UZJ25861.1 hypothetical protein RHODO2019_05340 [Rhodococcus antarcticus]
MLLPALLLAPALLLTVSTVGPPTPGTLCTPSDARLAELSALGVRAGTVLATGDGDVTEVLALDPASCAVTGTLDVGLDLRDVEDLAVAADGTVWLADTGDNRRTRDTVALVSVGEAGVPSGLHRLSYPDGPHDAEALLLQRDGRPVVVTKAVSGTAGVYAPDVPVDRLAEPGPTPMARVGQVRIAATDTPGGPVGSLGSVLVTGGAVSTDGTVAALRTYTDAYLWSVPDGDVVDALASDPVRVPLAGEPQGEAVAFTADGALLSGSEGPAGVLPAIRTVVGATGLAVVAPAQTPGATTPPASDQPAPASDGSGLERWQAAVIAVVVAGAVVWLVGRLRRAGRRR